MKIKMLKNQFRTNSRARSIREKLQSIFQRSNSPYTRIIQELSEGSILTVIDIGANVGQFGIDIRRNGFQGQIISFEPVKEIFTELSKTIKRFQPWEAFQLGLGSCNSQQTINISGNSGLSSSLLEMRSIHLNNYPESATISTQVVTITNIDDQLNALGIDPRKVLLKLDVQGFEAEVLKGAAKSLSKIPLCFLEVSIVPLYEGEITFLHILNLLSESGHEVVDIFRGLKTKNGQLLQVDILTKLTVKKSD
jgi:FkbM family methyltransferase